MAIYTSRIKSGWRMTPFWSTEASGHRPFSTSGIYDAMEVIDDEVTSVEENINPDDYQYNTDGMPAIVLPESYKSRSAAGSIMEPAFDDHYEDVSFSFLVSQQGKLYVSRPSLGIELLDSNTDWESVAGFGSNALAIRNGALYRITAQNKTNPTTSFNITQLGQDIGWTKVSGAVTNHFISDLNSYTAFMGICNGFLYIISHNDILKIQTSPYWTDCGGFAACDGIGFGLAIYNGSLFRIRAAIYSTELRFIRMDLITTATSVSGQLFYKSYGELDESFYHSVPYFNTTGAYYVDNGIAYFLDVSRESTTSIGLGDSRAVKYNNIPVTGVIKAVFSHCSYLPTGTHVFDNCHTYGIIIRQR